MGRHKSVLSILDAEKSVKRPGARGIGPGGQISTFFKPVFDLKMNVFSRIHFFAGKKENAYQNVAPG